MNKEKSRRHAQRNQMPQLQERDTGEICHVDNESRETCSGT